MIYFLSAVGFFKMVLYIIGFYFLFKILGRIFAPLLLKFVAKKAEQKFGEQFGGFQQNQQRKSQSHKDGETVIDKRPHQNRASDKSIGEYVDYEEVD